MDGDGGAVGGFGNLGDGDVEAGDCAAGEVDGGVEGV